MTPEFPRPLNLSELGRDELELTLEASAQERAALALRLGLVSLDRLHAVVTIGRRLPATEIAVAGRLSADVVQTCVVTLEPFPETVTEEFALRFTQDAAADEHEVELDAIADEPEPVEGASLDLGEIVAQQLSLALDPYPRKPGAVIELPAAEPQPAERPFAALARLKRH